MVSAITQDSHTFMVYELESDDVTPSSELKRKMHFAFEKYSKF